MTMVNKKENASKVKSLLALLAEKEKNMDNVRITIEIDFGNITRFSLEEVWTGTDFKFNL